MTLAWRSLVQIKHNPWELLDLSIQPIMFLLLFTYVFGGAISGSTGDYLQFALPGLLVQNALFYTLSTAIGLNTDITKGVFDRLRSLPIARTAPLSGRIIADTVKQVWASPCWSGSAWCSVSASRRACSALWALWRCWWWSPWRCPGCRC